jgi:SAM-dependent methyltransferase
MHRSLEPELMQDAEQVFAFYKGKKDYSIKHFLECYSDYVNLDSGKIIDLGSGTGEYLLALSQLYPGLEIVGYDGSLEMVKIANRNLAESCVQVKHLDFKDITDIADCVISTYTLHHLHDSNVFWNTAKNISKQCLIIDLIRPESCKQAELIVEQYAKDQPQLFKDDFLNSLLAAFSEDELKKQIAGTNLTMKIITGRFNTLQTFLIFGSF